MRILLTNDDGIRAPGLRGLYRALKQAGFSVDIVAPLSEMSAVGHSITIAQPLQVQTVKEYECENGSEVRLFEGLAVNGTPADCVKLALTTLLKDNPPELVVSGINRGANVGVDIIYSGTVSAATEGAFMGLRALAVSLDSHAFVPVDEQALWTADFIRRLDWGKIPKRRVLNLNFPYRPVAETLGLRVCPHTQVSYADWYIQRLNPGGRDYYWLTGDLPKEQIPKDTDRAILDQGYITLTPLHFDFSDKENMDSLQECVKDLY